MTAHRLTDPDSKYNVHQFGDRFPAPERQVTAAGPRPPPFAGLSSPLPSELLLPTPAEAQSVSAMCSLGKGDVTNKHGDNSGVQ